MSISAGATGRDRQLGLGANGVSGGNGSTRRNGGTELVCDNRAVLTRHAIIIALAAFLTVTLAAQGREVVWNMSVQLTERDKRDIIDLAAALGIRTPIGVVDDRSRCPVVRVRSQPVVEGNRVTTTDLRMRPRSGPDCRPATSGPDIHTRGNWMAVKFDARDGNPAYGNPRRLVAWRLRDGDWHRDVSLGPDVTYEDAEAIVLAIRHRTLVDVRNADEISKAGPPRVDPDQIFSVARFDDEPTKRRLPELYGDMYVVTSATHDDFTGRGGGGHKIHVKIRNGRVELHGSYFWIS
jgi:hypothetical protein